MPENHKTDQEYIDEGKAIVKKVEMTWREMGEWFNKIKLSRSKAGKAGQQRYQNTAAPSLMTAMQICKAADVKYETARKAGSVVEAFPTVESQRGLGLAKCSMLLAARNYLIAHYKGKTSGNQHFHEEFMADVAAGIPYRRNDSDPDRNYEYTGPWTLDDIKRQIALLTGKKIKVETSKTDKLEGDVLSVLEQELDGLPKNKQKKIKNTVAKELNKKKKELENEFEDEANRLAQTIVDKKLEKDKADLEESQRIAIELRKKAEKRERLASDLLKGVNAMMTKNEYRSLKQFVHPDKNPGREEQAKRMFEIVNRLGVGVDWD